MALSSDPVSTRRNVPSSQRSALITGGTRGIGLAIAERLAADGFALTLTARDEARLAEVAARLGDQHSGLVVAHHAADLRDLDSIDQVVQHHAQTHGDGISALVLNAGAGTMGDIGTITPSRFQSFVELNLRAPLHYLQCALPLLQRAAQDDEIHGAKVIAMSSITGVVAAASHGVYGATKAALASLIDTLNAEHSANGLTGTVISPAAVDTDMTAWNHEAVPPTAMIPTSDIAELVGSLVSLSRRSMVQQVVVARSISDGRCP